MANVTALALDKNFRMRL